MGVELWSAIVVTEYQNGKLEELLTLIDNLPEESKAEVLKRLDVKGQSQRSPNQFGTNSIVGPVVFQVSMMDKDSMAKMLHMMAEALGGVPNTNHS
jgi:hypothetical protein